MRRATSDSSWLYDSLLAEELALEKELGRDATYQERQQIEARLKREIASLSTIADAIAFGKKYDIEAGYYSEKLWPEQRQQTWNDAHPGGY